MASQLHLKVRRGVERESLQIGKVQYLNQGWDWVFLLGRNLLRAADFGYLVKHWQLESLGEELQAVGITEVKELRQERAMPGVEGGEKATPEKGLAIGVVGKFLGLIVAAHSLMVQETSVLPPPILLPPEKTNPVATMEEFYPKQTQNPADLQVEENSYTHFSERSQPACLPLPSEERGESPEALCDRDLYQQNPVEIFPLILENFVERDAGQPIPFS